MRSRSLIDVDVHATGPILRIVEEGTYERVRRTLDDALAELDDDLIEDAEEN
jgi:hypothetical protein